MHSIEYPASSLNSNNSNNIINSLQLVPCTTYGLIYIVLYRCIYGLQYFS